MNIERIMKGRITESLAYSLFENFGYRIIRLGVEEIFQEIKMLSEEQYRELNLDKGLRFLPDFLVSNPQLSESFQVEVKFRKNFNRNTRIELMRKINRQREFWPQTNFLIFVGESPRVRANFYQDYIKIISPQNPLENFDFEENSFLIWDRLENISDIFLDVPRDCFDFDFMVPIIKQLKEIFEGSI